MGNVKKYLNYFKRKETADLIEKLKLHSLKIRDVVEELKRAIDAYRDGLLEESRSAIQRVKSLENEADTIRRAIMLDIARSEIKAGDAEIIARLSTRVDFVGDEAKNAALTLEIILGEEQLLVEEGMSIGHKMRERLSCMVDTLVKEVRALTEAIKCLFEDLDKCYDLILEVGRLEHEIDLQYHEAKKELPVEMGIKTLFLLNDILTEIEDSSDLAEDASDVLNMLRVRFSLPGRL